MRHRMAALGMLAAGMTAMALSGGTGVAHADSNPFLPPTPGIIDQILTSNGALNVDPRDQDGPSLAWGGTGMYCENARVRCH